MLGYPKDEKAIFFAALEQATAREREVYLGNACADDPVLLQRVKVLLSVHDESHGPLDAPVGVPVATLDRRIGERPIAERPGTTIGPYKLLEQIGEGGFGVVFMAEQQQPLRRKVALKVIKPGMDSRQVVARFEAERQALALMDHPNIAHVFDGGTTDEGRPYFVMELVRGVSITEFCDESCLAIRQRLELFLDVCQAVQHAHQKGIIHRDIKPNNLMVTLHDGTPVVKVIDFGIAKALGQQLTEKTLFTNFAQMIGTPLYMSPEQAAMSGLDIDTRGDVYSLGVMLYELLTGTTPFENARLSQVGYDEMRRIIREEEPPKPSARISTVGRLTPTVSGNRGSDARKLSKLFRGELDWIVMKALEKDRNRRYETSAAFAADVRHYLHDEPVQACPPSTGYRLRKFVRRNKRAVGSAAVLGLAGLVIAGTLGWAVRDRDAHEKEAARERAVRHAAVEQEVNLALKEAERWQEQAHWPEALSAAKRAEGFLAGGASDQVRERVHQFRSDLDMVLRLDDFRAQRKSLFDHESMNDAYAHLFVDFGIDAENLSPPEIAARIARRPATAVRVAGALDDWAQLLRDWGLYDRKREPATWKRLLEAARLADPDPWRSQLRQLMGQHDLNALRMLSDASDMTALPVQSLQLMGNALTFAGDQPACVAWLRKAHRQHPGDAPISFDLAFHLSQLPSADCIEILRFAEAGLAARPNSFMYTIVGGALHRLGRYDEALACLDKAIELKPDSAMADATLRRAHHNRAATLDKLGRHADAVNDWDRALELNAATQILQFQFQSLFRSGRALSLARAGEHAEAVAEANAMAEANDGGSGALYDLACVCALAAAAVTDDAKLQEQYAARAVELLREAVATGYTNSAHMKTDKDLDALRDGEEFRKLLADVEAKAARKEAATEAVGANDAKAYIGLGQIHAQIAQWKEAAAAFDRALEIDPLNPDVWILAAAARAATGDVDGYRGACAQIVERFANATEAQTAERCAKVCLLMPDALSADDLERLQKLAERAVTGTEKHDLHRFFAMVKGLADYRAGRYADAIKWTKVAVPHADGSHWNGTKFAVLAMAHHMLGHIEEAQTASANAQAIMANMPDPAKARPFGPGDWQDWLHAQVLCREAEALLKTPPTETGP